MGKTSKPLTIVVFPPLDEWEEINKLEKQGHRVLYVPDPKREGSVIADSLLIGADIILGPRCWFMTPVHRKHLTVALKEARLRRYGTVHRKGDDDVEQDTTDSSSSSDSN